MSTLNAEASVSRERTSEQYRAYVRREHARKRWIAGTQIALIVLFFGAWELFPRMHWINPLFVSYPSALWPAFLVLLKTGHLLHHTAATVIATLIGFALSMLIGMIVAAWLWWSNFAYKVLDPFLVMGNAMPKTAFIPIFYVWLGATYSIYGIAVAITVFITIMMIYTGFRGIDPGKVKLMRTLGATRWQVLTKLVIPGSVPTLLAAIKMSFGLSLVGVIVGEFESANSGLGYLILYGSQIFKFNMVMASIVILALISGLMYLIVSAAEKALLRRYG
jgi:NitT/TauT family transport system permease protein